MNQFKTFFRVLLFIATPIITFAQQTGSIRGIIKDAKSGEVAIGATVKVEGTNLGASTDINGAYEIKRVPAGKQKISVSYIGYITKEVANVQVEPNGEAIVNVSVQEDNQSLDEVVVKAQRITSTDISLITEIKELQQIAVGVSGQQIQKTQDRDASAVVRRIPGVSIFDDRFIVVRGLNERYNTVLINDMITPSTEVDSKSFSFDLIPSTAIDRMLVFKSASADLPGDMGGGAIKIYTKTIPMGNSLSASLSLGYRQATTGLQHMVSQGSPTDWLGYDNGQRQLPVGFASRNSIAVGARSEAVIEKFRSLQPYYDVVNETARPDIRGSLNYTHTWRFRSRKELSNVSYFNYSLTNQAQSIFQNRYTFQNDVERQFNDQALNQNVRLGAMSNWTLVLNNKNKLEFRNLVNQMGFKETVFRTGFNENVDLENGSLRYEQRSILSSQVGGTHELSKLSKLKWTGGFGYTYRLEPDYRRYTRSREKGSTAPFTFDLQQSENPTLQQAARSFSNLDELLYSGRVDYDFILKNDFIEKKRTVLKVGAYGDYKDRIFFNKWYGITNPNRLSGDALITKLAPEQFFDVKNLGSNSVYYAVGTNFEDRYTAQNYFGAGYAQVYYPVNDKLNFTAGFRGEYNQQQLQSRERGSGQPVSVENPAFNPLPSANLMYQLNQKSVLRVAYSSTVNRPEFRELAPFTYYDFVYDVTRTGFQPRPGKDKLLNASIQNLDLRYEFYPTEGDMFTVALFNKQFRNPIEAKVFYNGSNVAFTVDNAEKAFSRGVELEFRSKITNNLTALFNGALIASNVVAGGGTGLSDRSLQGQSPYLINTALYYQNERRGLQANILYNVIGKRIFVIGDDLISANIYEMPRNVIDLNITKSLTKKIDLKLSAQDILNQPFRLIQDTDRNNKITDADGTYQEFRRGSSYTAGIVVNFK
jgi:TonB-dependent receptor